MKVRLPKWLSQPAIPGAPALSTEEAIRQLEGRLTEADNEVREAETRSQELMAKFAEARTPETLEAQEAAEGELKRLQKLRAIVVTDLEAARAKLAAEERAADEALEARLVAEISDASEEIRLAELEADEIERVAQARIARQNYSAKVRGKRAELHSVRLRLDKPTEMRFEYVDTIMSPHLVIEVLKRRVQELGNDPRAGVLYGFAKMLETSWR